MRPSLPKLSKSVIAAATATVILGTGTGTALAATSGSAPGQNHKVKTTETITMTTPQAEQAMQEFTACFEARDDLAKAQAETLGTEAVAYFGGFEAVAALFGAPGWLVDGGIDGIAALYDGATLSPKQINVLTACYPGLFKSGGSLTRTQPWLSNLRKNLQKRNPNNFSGG